MDDLERQQLEKIFEVTDKILNNKESLGLSDSDVKEFENINATIAGVFLSNWLPSGIVRRFFMFLFFGLGILGSLFYSLYFLFFLIIAGMFSPRLVGKVAVLLGKLNGN
ncbi:MAG: hypothetical protein Q8P49_04645 [Candidatus Liptonbacteria bacterium]|nr:hypothetical protein [Candidatus Liptonbacteria bacterium]